MIIEYFIYYFIWSKILLNVFSIDLINNLIDINENNGLIYFNRFIDVGIYNFNIKYSVNGTNATYLYQLIILPIINYSTNSQILPYKRLNESYSLKPYTAQQNGNFIIS